MTLISVNKFLKRYRYQCFTVSASFLGGVIFPDITKCDSFQQYFVQLTSISFNKPAFVVGLFGLSATAMIFLTTYIIDHILKKQNITEQFAHLMKRHTAEIINGIDNTYSWGSDYCLFYCQDPTGWLSKQFKITDYNQNEYTFPKKELFKHYSKADYDLFVSGDPRIKAIQDKEENRNRFAVKHFKKNTNKQNVVFDISIRKTKWIPLQFHWQYFRTFDMKTGTTIDNPNIECVKEQMLLIQKNQGSDFLINSFCLHLIVGTPEGLIISRIGRTKENDYPSTWAATLGEQISETDFYDKSSSKEGDHLKKNFIDHWVKRALNEELGVDPETEYDELFDSDSLRVLSVNIEADIYNISITCVINIKGTFEDWMRAKANDIDRCENFEMKECTLEEIRRILLSYPDNCTEYHPSTYLRMLMFHRYRMGTEKTRKLLMKMNNSQCI